jgi:adenylyl-sulfate kinase
MNDFQLKNKRKSINSKDQQYINNSNFAKLNIIKMIKKQKAKVLWFLGLPAAGKTTIASLLQKKLQTSGYQSLHIDADVLRDGLNADLGFTATDRYENIRRTAEITKLLLNNNIIVICSFITPLNKMRDLAKNIIGKENILFFFVNTPLDICIKRDPKQLYEKAIHHQIKDFTVISAPFEPMNEAFMNILNYNALPEDIVSEIFCKLEPLISQS